MGFLAPATILEYYLIGWDKLHPYVNGTLAIYSIFFRVEDGYD